MKLRSILSLLFLSCTLALSLFLYEPVTNNSTARPEAEWEDRLNNFRDWAIYRGDKTAIQYSELSQINLGNVSKLEKAWEYKHGNPVGPGMYSNPIIVDGLLYFTTPEINAIAKDFATNGVVPPGLERELSGSESAMVRLFSRSAYACWLNRDFLGMSTYAIRLLRYLPGTLALARRKWAKA